MEAIEERQVQRLDRTKLDWTGLDWTLVAEARATTEPLFFEEKQVELWIVTGD